MRTKSVAIGTSSKLGPCHFENNVEFRRFARDCMGLLQEICKGTVLIVETKGGANLFPPGMVVVKAVNSIVEPGQTRNFPNPRDVLLHS